MEYLDELETRCLDAFVRSVEARDLRLSVKNRNHRVEHVEFTMQ